VKIGKYNIQSPFREKVLDADHAKGLFPVPDKTVYKVTEVTALYDLYSNHDLVRGMIDDLAEAAAGQGYYNTVKVETPVLKKSKPRDLVNSFGEQFNLDNMFPKIAKNVLIAGFCPVESKIVADPEKCALKIVHPKTVDQIISDPLTGEILSIHQKVGSQENTILGENLAWFDYGNVANDPRGLSFIQSIGEILGILDDTTNVIKNITERYIAPIAIWKSRQPSEALKKAVTSREAGEDVFLGNLTESEMGQKSVEFVTVDPRVPFWDFMENLQVRVYSYSRASNLWMTRNANLASAEKLEDIVARHVNAIQRGLKRSAEKYWYKKLMLANGFEEVPRLNFGKEPTGVEDITPSDIITKGLELGYIDQSQFYEILKSIGVKVTEKEQSEQDENSIEEQDKEDADKEAPQKPTQNKSMKELREEIERHKMFEAMQPHEAPFRPKMKFKAQIKGDTIEGTLEDAEHQRPATKFTVEDKPL